VGGREISAGRYLSTGLKGTHLELSDIDTGSGREHWYIVDFPRNFDGSQTTYAQRDEGTMFVP
jgi:hypothetical protein